MNRINDDHGTFRVGLLAAHLFLLSGAERTGVCATVGLG